ncbi:MAG TPA: hypothetical protein VMF66_02665 [Candidatus Acidoferrum sp.]|nr:hypothetical protein [Candidatus Acidoferrum sp.]
MNWRYQLSLSSCVAAMYAIGVTVAIVARADTSYPDAVHAYAGPGRCAAERLVGNVPPAARRVREWYIPGASGADLEGRTVNAVRRAS